MRKVTVSTPAGRTITTDRPELLRDQLRRWGTPSPYRIIEQIEAGRMQNAGNMLAREGLNFAFAGEPLPGFEIPEVFQPELDVQQLVDARDAEMLERDGTSYIVPIDPSSLNDCDSCQ